MPASMGPRHFSRGRLCQTTAAEGTPDPMLQWGHGIVSRGIRTPAPEAGVTG